jgi:hypothetical protein
MRTSDNAGDRLLTSKPAGGPGWLKRTFKLVGAIGTLLGALAILFGVIGGWKNLLDFHELACGRVQAFASLFGDCTGYAKNPTVSIAEIDEILAKRQSALEERLEHLKKALTRPQVQSPAAQDIPRPSENVPPILKTPVSPVPQVPAPQALLSLAKPALPEQATPEPCTIVGFRIERPISVGVGDQLCPKDGSVKATILNITSYFVIYSNPGYGNTTCRKAERCRFNWDRSPLFSIDIIENTGNSRRALLLDSR